MDRNAPERRSGSFFKNRNGVPVHFFLKIPNENQIAELNAAIDTIPITSADAERGFSTMNIICTPVRNRLGVERLSNFIFVSLVGPSVDCFNALPYVKKWLRRGHHAACDNQSRKSQPLKQECRYDHVRKIFD